MRKVRFCVGIGAFVNSSRKLTNIPDKIDQYNYLLCTMFLNLKLFPLIKNG